MYKTSTSVELKHHLQIETRSGVFVMVYFNSIVDMIAHEFMSLAFYSQRLPLTLKQSVYLLQII